MLGKVFLFSLIFVALSCVTSSIAFAGLISSCDSQADVAPELGDDKFHEFIHGGRKRSFILHLPKRLLVGRPVEVVFALHGGFGSACVAREKMDLNRVSEGYTTPYVVVYPNGIAERRIYGDIGRHWNDGRLPETASSIDDVGFLEKIIDRLANEHGLQINRRRVFAVGMSNGGMMALRLVRDSNRFAGIVAIAASMPVNLVKPGGPALKAVPSMLIAGTEDGMMPYGGGSLGSFIGGEVFSIEETQKRLSAAVGATPTRVKPYLGNWGAGIKRVDWFYQDGWSPRARNMKRAELIKIYGGGHCVPGPQTNPRARAGGACAQALNASLEALIFFDNQPDLRPGI